MNLIRAKIKSLFVRCPLACKVMSLVTKHTPRIFVYHRFCNKREQLNNAYKIDRETFEWQLRQINRGWSVMTLKDYCDKLRRGKRLTKVVIITVDDGYKDFYDYAYPLLKKYNLLATFFPTVDFINGNIWLWPDRLKHMLDKTDKILLKIHYNGMQHEYPLTSLEYRTKAWHELTKFCILINTQEREKFLKQLGKTLHVTVPELPPLNYAPISWDELKEVLSHGIEIGCHTMTHPILARETEERIYYEVVEAKKQLEDQLNTKIISFCYPNSAPGDINEIVVRTVRNAGYRNAVFGTDLTRFDDWYQIPRIGVSNDKTDFLWKLWGYEAFVMKLKFKWSSFLDNRYWSL